ncbi:uncharacterized protein EI90DRAFT_3120429 [Cantharellus anzutake]|uniref:uncharacterized protein n=1 Tax=Cantharellus anzutake TaxID=1750568 RepID=UPI00190526CD|nr:uncharacterized protein EI90DRAFT_3120429 [Cantharellus anzutake]KAF8335370.1 hypothetical protein EI90DRAFT_3120429 [Cantharellus anzutake]
MGATESAKTSNKHSPTSLLDVKAEYYDVRGLRHEYAKPMLPTPDLHSGIPFASPSPEPPVLAPTSDFDPTSAYTHCIG